MVTISRREKVRKAVGYSFLYLFLIALGAVFVFPYVFMISRGLMTAQRAEDVIMHFFPDRVMFSNYIHAFSDGGYGMPLVHSLWLSALNAFAVPFSSLLAAYAFVYFRFKGKGFLYFIMLSTLFIPFTVTMIPNYLLISKIGLRDRIWGVALPQLADVLGIFLLRQAMRGIPLALIEAARMENIRHMKIMRDIVIPLVRPSIISTGIIFFINSWNEYVWPVLILKSKENYTLSLALQMYISAEGGTEFTIAMAVSVLTMLIPLVLYIIFQRYIINTFAASGLKG